MTVLDVVALAVMALSALYGVVRGFIREVLSLTVWVAAFWLSIRLAPAVAVHLESHIHNDGLRSLAAAAGLFLVILMAGMVGAGVLQRIVRFGGIGGPDRALGAAFGVLRGVVLVTLLVMVGSVTPLAEGEDWRASRLIGYFEILAERSISVLDQGHDWNIPELDKFRAPSGG